jgi:glycosyltransferase involved in cell wall biosynthesis
MTKPGPLAIIETHPIQYHAPVWRAVQQRFGVDVTAIYGSDFSVVGYRDKDFATSFKWDTDLLSGYRSLFLSKVNGSDSSSTPEVNTRGLNRLLREVNPSAVMVVGYSPRFHTEAFWQALRLGKPIMFRGETGDHTKQRAPLKACFRDAMLHQLYGRCSKLLYVGQRSRQHFERLHCPEPKLTFSPYCVDITPFACDEAARTRLRTETRRELGIPDDRVAVLFTGKLYEHKKPALLLRALGSLGRDVTLLLVGSGPQEQALKELAAHEPRVTTHFLGFKNQAQLSPFYHAADLFALPSLSETWGLVINEALHHGLPCVVSNSVGCWPDLIEPGVTGEVCETDSIESLVAALPRAIALVGQPEIRDKCRTRVGGYSVEKAADGIASAYRQVVHV